MSMSASSLLSITPWWPGKQEDNDAYLSAEEAEDGLALEEEGSDDDADSYTGRRVFLCASTCAVFSCWLSWLGRMPD
jgi:hypothetical protein